MTTKYLLAAALGTTALVTAPFNADVDAWNDLVAAIEEAAPKADPADHRHLARAAAGGATFFVTRDGELNAAAPRILEAIGVEVMRPEELITYVDRLRAEERYEPSALHATPFEIAPAAAHDVDFVATFLNYGEGERKVALEATLRAALASPDDHEALVVSSGVGGLLGGVVRKIDRTSVNVQVMRSSFLAVFLAAAPLSAALGAWGIAAFGAPGAGAALAGALAYLGGCFAVTMLGNVPLNNRLARVTPDTAEAVWRDYRRRWTRWNHVRTLASLVAAALFTLAYRAV